MKLTVVAKLGIGIGTLLVLILISGLVSLWQNEFIESKIREITEVEEPTSAAAFEMEINLLGTGFALVAYLHDHDPAHLERIAKDEADFEHFQRRYHELAEIERDDALGDELADTREVTIGLNYYIKAHQVKMQADYSWLRNNKSKEGQDDDRVRIQLQLFF